MLMELRDLFLVSAGKCIVDSSTPLQKMPIEHLVHSLRSPKAEIDSQIRQLRLVRDLDQKRYNQLKRYLPFFVCASFNPPYRRAENFSGTSFFLIDIDKLTRKGFVVDALKNKLKADARVFLIFISPSEDGLKVMFRLSEPCRDSGVYSLFYRAFASRFSEEYGLQQVIDTVTCDVTRACFVSCDSDAYYNPDAEPIDINDYLDFSDAQSIADLRFSLDRKECELAEVREVCDSEERSSDPDDETIEAIKQKLKLRSKPKPMLKPEPFAPEELRTIVGDLVKYIEDNGLKVDEVVSIAYGRKFWMSVGTKRAQVVLYYGKRGFSVVIPPCSITDVSLNEVAVEIINSFLEEGAK